MVLAIKLYSFIGLTMASQKAKFYLRSVFVDKTSFWTLFLKLGRWTFLTNLSNQNKTKLEGQRPLRLNQMQMALLVPDDSLLKNIYSFAKWDVFHLGYVLPSNNVFSSDGASLRRNFDSSKLFRLIIHRNHRQVNFIRGS